MKRVEQDILMSDLIYKHLRGALKGNEADVLEAWLQNPENMRFFMELKNSDRLYQGVEKMRYTDEQSAWWQMEAKMAKIRRRRWLRRFYMVAALVVVALGGGLLWLLRGGDVGEGLEVPVVAYNEQPAMTIWKMEDKEVYLSDTLKKLVLPQEKRQSVERKNGVEETKEEPVRYEEFITAEHDRLHVVLFDGTRVWLNGGSRLKYPSRFAENSREVELSGEAYFEVMKDSERPFRVHTAAAKIEVLGTGFNVSAVHDRACVTTLVEGRVCTEDRDAHRVELLPGQQAVLNEHGGWKVEEVDVRYFTAWKEGLFAFKDAKLETILEELAHYYGVQFRFETSEIAGLAYTTIIKQYENVEEVLSILEKVGDFACERIGENLFEIQRK